MYVPSEFWTTCSAPRSVGSVAEVGLGAAGTAMVTRLVESRTMYPPLADLTAKTW